jgi:hypothetical protein
MGPLLEGYQKIIYISVLCISFAYINVRGVALTDPDCCLIYPKLTTDSAF